MLCALGLLYLYGGSTSEVRVFYPLFPSAYLLSCFTVRSIYFTDSGFDRCTQRQQSTEAP